MKVTVTKIGGTSQIKLRCDSAPPKDFCEVLRKRGFRWKPRSNHTGYWLGSLHSIPKDEITRQGWELWIDDVKIMESSKITSSGPEPTRTVSATTSSPVPEPTQKFNTNRVLYTPTYAPQRPKEAYVRSLPVLEWLKKLDYYQLRYLCAQFGVKAFTTRSGSEIILDAPNLMAGLLKAMVEKAKYNEDFVVGLLETSAEKVPSKRVFDSSLPASLITEKKWKKFVEDGGKVNSTVEISSEQLANEVNNHVRARADAVYGIMESSVAEAAKELCKAGDFIKRTEEAIAEAAEKARPVVHHVKTPSKTVVLKDVILPKEFEEILRYASIGVPVMMVGPTGCGKTFIAKQVADALELPFGAISCSIGQSESELKGWLLPTGNNGQFQYKPSEFVRIYENGGVFLFDEGDNLDPNYGKIINMALSGTDGFHLPQRYDKPFVKRHKDFVPLMGANTFGAGGDLQYVGAEQLDESTLDRFRAGTVVMDYSAEVEEMLVDADILAWGRLTREKITSHRLRRNLSTRFLRDRTIFKAAYPEAWSKEGDYDMLTRSWKEDEKVKVKV